MLHYTDPARHWDEALPLGNGRVGAMLYGGVHDETLRLNEESVWYGGPLNRTPVGAKSHLEDLRKLIREGRHGNAENLVRKRFLATPRSARHYEPLGACNIRFDYKASNGSHGTGDTEDAVEEYRRNLDLSTAEATVECQVNGVAVRRQAIATHADNVIAIRVSAERKISFTVGLTRMSDVDWEVNEFVDSIHAVDNRVILHATPGGKDSNALCLVAAVRVDDDAGCVQAVGQELEVSAKEALVVLAAHTQYRHADVERAACADIDAALGLTTNQLWQRHVEDWTRLFNRMSIELYPNASHHTTDGRLKKHRDPGLAALYHAYSRYLLLSCSRSYPKALPATLQGIWNPSFQPPWGSKYTININLQMNYWAAHVSNLSECELPLFDLLERMAAKGKRTALEVYSCRGWCAHHCTDMFGDTETQDRWMPATLWPLGGAWLCTHIWEHYTFTGNTELLARMMPVLEGCVLFLLDYLVPDSGDVYLVTNPSLSPENTFVHGKSGEKGVFCEGSTIDTEIVREVFTQYLRAMSTLHGEETSSNMIQDVKVALSRLTPTIISPRTGAIQEWGLQDYEESEPGHRHISHLYSLHPGTAITPESTPELAEAATKTLLRRLENGGGHTGWSRAWLINMWARLRRPDECARNIEALLKDSTLPNLLDTHPPFQIDGNFGGAAGIVECLVQSHEEVRVEGESTLVRLIRLLPSCPQDWEEGSIKGVKCRGGFELEFSWKKGRIIEPVFVRSWLGHHAIVVFHGVGCSANDRGTRVRIPAVQGVHEVPIPVELL